MIIQTNRVTQIWDINERSVSGSWWFVAKGERTIDHSVILPLLCLARLHARTGDSQQMNNILCQDPSDETWNNNPQSIVQPPKKNVSNRPDTHEARVNPSSLTH